MKSKNIILIIGMVALSIGVGASLWLNSQGEGPIANFVIVSPSLPEPQVESQPQVSQEKDVLPQVSKSDEKNILPEAAIESETISFSGKVIAGSKTPYIRYNKADFEKARSENKATCLYCYATWCSICAAERPGIFAAFKSLELSDAVGFEVHWADGQNTREDNDIAREYGVGSQHAHVYVDKDSSLSHKPLQTSSSEEIKNRLTSLAHL